MEHYLIKLLVTLFIDEQVYKVHLTLRLIIRQAGRRNLFFVLQANLKMKTYSIVRVLI